LKFITKQSLNSSRTVLVAWCVESYQ